MNELATKNDPYRAAVAMAMVSLTSVLNTYGKKDDQGMLQGWLSGLKARQFPMDLIEPTAEWYCGFAKDMPTPGEFCEKGFRLAHRREIDEQLALTAARERTDRIALESRICRELKAAGVDMSTTYTPSDVAALLSGAPSRFGGEE